MKTVIFEITKKKTEVIIDGERTDITNTEVEKKFVKTLKELQSHRTAEQILDAIDMSKWSEGS